MKHVSTCSLSVILSTEVVNAVECGNNCHNDEPDEHSPVTSRALAEMNDAWVPFATSEQSLENSSDQHQKNRKQFGKRKMSLFRLDNLLKNYPFLILIVEESSLFDGRRFSLS